MALLRIQTMDQAGGRNIGARRFGLVDPKAREEELYAEGSG
jgi:hypothetical protein